jgi:putative transposase
MAMDQTHPTPLCRKPFHRYNTPGHAHFLTFNCNDKNPYFLDRTACEIFLDVLEHARHLYRFTLWAYVVMSTHAHVLVWPRNSTYDLGKACSGIKGITSKRYCKHLQKTNPELCERIMVTTRRAQVFRFWLPGGGYDSNLYKGQPTRQVIQYIENNPVRARLVRAPEQYRWSSAYARAHGTAPAPDPFAHVDTCYDPTAPSISIG